MKQGKIMTAALIGLSLLAAPQAQALKTLVIINNAPGVDMSERLVSSVPYSDQQLDASPPVVSLTFSRPIQPGKSQLRVYNMYGAQVSDEALKVEATTMSVALPEQPSGRYSVKWRTRCLCDDDTELFDQFHFSIR